MKNRHGLWAIVLAAGLGWSCAQVLVQPKSNLQVFIKLKGRQIKESSLLIFNFKEPDYAAGKGSLVAQLCHQIVMRERLFKTIALNAQFPWTRLADSEESQMMEAVKEGTARGFDYVLLGNLAEYIYGGLNKTRIRIALRIIETKTRQTFFYAENALEAASNDPSFAMDSQLSTTAEPLEKACAKILTEIAQQLPEKTK